MTRNAYNVGLGALVCLLLPLSAIARPSGISGYSGQQGQTCTQCHGAGAAVPTVTLEGPASVEPGKSQQYTVVIKGGPAAVGGVDISVDDPSAKLQAGDGTYLSGAELTHSMPKTCMSGEVRFPFTVTAPSADGVMTLYAAGMSANGNGGTSGDGVAATSLQVQVTASPSATPTPTPTPTPTQPTNGTGTPTVSTPVPETTPQTGCTAAGAGAPILAAIGALAGIGRRRRSKR